MRYNDMKNFQIFIIMLLALLTISSPSYAYLVKIYNDVGEQIGTARKSGGNDFKIYDMNGNKVEDYEKFYAPTGLNLKPVSNYDPTQYWIKTGKYSSRPLFFIPTPKLKIKRTGF